mgnify:CR=1 FL=1
MTSSAMPLSRRAWAVVAVGGVLTLARFSEAFLILRAQEAGLGLAFIPVALIVMNVVYAAQVAATAPRSVRATAFGLFSLISGVLMIAASGIAGALWVSFGSAATFTIGGVFSAIALMGAAALLPTLKIR